MKLKKITLKNMRSYEQQTISFPEGSLLLAGDVGSGKTTLLLAIEYALFGLQPGQKGSALLRSSASSGEVILECEIEGQEITLERHLKRENKSIASDYCALTLDGETREYSVTELKSKVLELLGYPAEFIKKNNLLYRYTVYTPQEQMKQIILEDSETRLNVLRHIFGIDKYKRIRENLTLLTSKLKEESKVLQGEVNTMEYDRARIAQLKKRTSELHADIENKTALFTSQVEQRKIAESELIGLDQKLKEKEKFEREVEKTSILIGLKQEALASAEKEYQELTLAISGSVPFDQNEYAQCAAELSLVKSALMSLDTSHITLSSQSNSLERAQKEQKEQKERVFSIDICAACLQDVPEVHKHNILNETEKKLAEIKRHLSLIAEQSLALQKKRSEELQKVQELEQKKLALEISKSRSEYLLRAQQKLVELSKNKENSQKDLSLLIMHLEDLKSQIFQFSKFSTHYRLKNDELKRAFMSEKQAEIAVAELKKEAEITLSEIQSLERLIVEKQQTENRLSRISFVVDWLSTQFLSLLNFTEIQVLLKLRREFSRVFNHWFHMVAGESFEVHLDENFTPLIMQGDVEMEYSFLSGGERTAVALAYRLALNQTINSVLSEIKTRDIVILDEPTEGFSEAQIDKVRDVLEELKVAQLIIVSHEQKVESFVDNVIRLKKIGDISEVDLSSPSSSLESSGDDAGEGILESPKTLNT